MEYQQSLTQKACHNKSRNEKGASEVGLLRVGTTTHTVSVIGPTIHGSGIVGVQR